MNQQQVLPPGGRLPYCIFEIDVLIKESLFSLFTERKFNILMSVRS